MFCVNLQPLLFLFYFFIYIISHFKTSTVSEILMSGRQESQGIRCVMWAVPQPQLTQEDWGVIISYRT